jgi:putative oxidoreductase
MNNNFRHILARISHWPLRLALSSVFLYHGLTKFPNLEGFAASMNAPVILVFLLACVEVSGALLVLFGGIGRDWMTRLGGLFLLPVMIGAILIVHLPHGWNSVNMGTGNMGRGMEFQFVLLMIALHFLLKGNQSIGGDTIRGWKRTRKSIGESERPPIRSQAERPKAPVESPA